MVRTRFTDPTKGIDLNSDGAPFLLDEYKIIKFRLVVDSLMFAINVSFERSLEIFTQNSILFARIISRPIEVGRGYIFYN